MRWPGNVRELENTIHRAVLLRQWRRDRRGGDPLARRRPRSISARRRRRWRTPRSPPKQVTRALVGRTVADVERDLILETLKHCLGNRTHAANILGISIRTLRNKLNEYSGAGLPIAARLRRGREVAIGTRATNLMTPPACPAALLVSGRVGRPHIGLRHAVALGDVHLLAHASGELLVRHEILRLVAVNPQQMRARRTRKRFCAWRRNVCSLRR